LTTKCDSRVKTKAVTNVKIRPGNGQKDNRQPDEMSDKWQVGMARVCSV